MPIISEFYGIIIRMYFLQSEHNPPHIHAIYGDLVAIISIKEGHIIQGNIPNKAYKLVYEWLTLYRDDLLQMWENQCFKKLPPIK